MIKMSDKLGIVIRIYVLLFIVQASFFFNLVSQYALIRIERKARKKKKEWPNKAESESTRIPYHNKPAFGTIFGADFEFPVENLPGLAWKVKSLPCYFVFPSSEAVV